MEAIAGTTAGRASAALAINPTGNVMRGAGAVAGGTASGTMKTVMAVNDETAAPSFESYSGNQSLPGFATPPGQMQDYGYMGGGSGIAVLPK